MKVLKLSLKNGIDYVINMDHVTMLSTNKRASIGDTPKLHVTIHLVSGARIDLADADIEELYKLWTNTINSE